MNEQIKSIREQADELLEKVLAIWKKDGKWDNENNSSPFYGIEKDPVVLLLLTAFIYQSNIIKESIENFRDSITGELGDCLLPYHFTQAVPAFSMMQTAKSKSANNACYVDENTVFTIKKNNSKKESFTFYPLFKTKIVNAQILDIEHVSDKKWNLSLKVLDDDKSLSGLTFLFDKHTFLDFDAYCENERIPFFKPWQCDRFALIDLFSPSNSIYNKSLIYGNELLWRDIWASHNLMLFMIDPSWNNSVNENGVYNIVFDFLACPSSFSLNKDDVKLNCFPVVNVTTKDCFLSKKSPVAKLTSEYEFEDYDNLSLNDDNQKSEVLKEYFMNLVGNGDSQDYIDSRKFFIRRYGAERFNINELLHLADKILKRFNTDFYAFQSIPSLQDSEKMRKLSIVLKDVVNVIKKEGLMQTGVYAMLNYSDLNPDSDSDLHVKALFSNGKSANGLDADSTVLTRGDLDRRATRLIMKTIGGKDEIVDSHLKEQIAKYYVQTNDRIVTRSDMKAFCIKHLLQVGFARDSIKNIEIVNDFINDTIIQEVVVKIDETATINPDDMFLLCSQMEKMIKLRCSSAFEVKVSFSF